MADHAMNETCRAERTELKEKLTEIRLTVFGNGNKENSLVTKINKLENKNLVTEEDLEDYKFVTKDELGLRVAKLATSEDLKEMKTDIISFIRSYFNKRTDEEQKRFKLTQALIKAVPPVIITATASIITALILKG